MIFHRFTVLTALSLFAAVSASANLTCPGMSPVPFSTIETEIDLGMGQVIEAKDIDCKKVAIGAKVVTGIQQMVAGELPAPKSITFRMVDTFDNAFFAPEDGSLNVPYQIVLDSYTKNPVYSPAIWAHEFGHAILDATLERLSANAKWRSLIKRNLTDSAVEPGEAVQILLAPYHEFFADVIAVLYSGNPRAVSDGLYMTGFMANPEGSPTACPNKSDPKCRPRNSQVDMHLLATSRDFSDRHNQLGAWKGVDPRDDHNLLAPARYHIYKYYLSNALIKKQRGRLAGATVDAILTDVNERLKRVQSLPGGFTTKNLSKEMSDVKRINSEFLDVIDETMQKTFKEL